MKRWKRFLLLGFVFILLTGCTANHSESYRNCLFADFFRQFFPFLR